MSSSICRLCGRLRAHVIGCQIKNGKSHDLFECSACRRKFGISRKGTNTEIIILKEEEKKS